MSQFDTIIRGGTVIDGSRMPRFKADIGIQNGNITAIGQLDKSQAKQVLDASGMYVVPGFIDLHTHYDAQLFWDPYCSISSWHGVTSVVIGNCGFGFAPCHPEGPRTLDADDDAQRSDPLRMHEGRHAVGLGDLPAVSRQRRAPRPGASTCCPTCRCRRSSPM